MSKRYYYLRELILGLRSEYIKIERKLKALDAYLVYNREMYKSAFYVDIDSLRKTTNIRLELLRKKKKILESLQKISSNNFLPTSIRTEIHLRLDGFSDGIIMPSKSVEIMDRNNYYLKADQIATNEFVRGFQGSKTIEAVTTKVVSADVNMSMNGISLITNRRKPDALLYLPKKDTITFSSGDMRLMDVLDSKVDAEGISEFHRTILDRQEIKPLILDEDYSNGNYGIAENYQYYILYPKSNKK